MDQSCKQQKEEHPNQSEQHVQEQHVSGRKYFRVQEMKNHCGWLGRNEKGG